MEMPQALPYVQRFEVSMKKFLEFLGIIDTTSSAKSKVLTTLLIVGAAIVIFVLIR